MHLSVTMRRLLPMASLSTASLLWTILVAAPLARSQNLVMVLGKVEDLVEPSQLVVMPLVVERRCTPVTLLVWPARVERAAPVEVPHSLGWTRTRLTWL